MDPLVIKQRKADKIIKEYDYQPNQFAQSLRARRTNLIEQLFHV